jgi:Clp amino terminal domain, pathogenicity island component/DinB superfamily
VFERFNVNARRSIHFALQEAHGLGSPQIKTVHVLLGILREDEAVATRVGSNALQTIRRELEQHAPADRPRSPGSGDLPLSGDTRRALLFAIKEAAALQRKAVEPAHLVLGLLRIEKCTAARLLRAYGMNYDRYRAALRTEAGEEPPASRPTERAIEREAPPSIPVAAPLLAASIRSLENLLDKTSAHLHAYSDAYGDQRLKRKPWTRKEALGHLIDWAMAHQQWMGRALAESKLSAAGYPDEAEVAIQQYADFSWSETVDLWVMLNRLLVHVLQRVPEGKLEAPCRIGIAAPVPLRALVDGYVEHCEDMAGQILAHL